MVYRCEQCGKEMPTGYPTYIVEVRKRPRRFRQIYDHDKETKLVDIEVCEECKNKIMNGFRIV